MSPNKTLSFILPSFTLFAALAIAGCGASKRPGSTMVSRSAPAPSAGMQADAPAMEGEPASSGFSDVNTDKALNTAGYVRTWSPDLLGTSSKFRSEVYRLGGYVVNERLDYGDRIRARKARLPNRARVGERNKTVFSISLPVEELPRLLDWVRGNSRIVEQFVTAARDAALPTPASVALQEQGLRRAVLEERLKQLISALALAETAEERVVIEQERVGIADELSQLSKAAVAVTEPVVKYATLSVYIETDRPQARFSASRVVATLRPTLLVTNLLGKKSERDTRVGGAIGIALPDDGPGGLFPSPLLEVAGYQATDDSDAGVVATIGTGRFARSTGDGARTWLNPFIGARMGYAHVDRHAFVVAGEIGVEIFKSAGIALSASLRPSAFIGKDSDVVLESGSSLSVAF
jgi:hypothetical protein